MDVFISWSGQRSKKVADFLFSWLRKLPLTIVPWVSGEAIDPGTRWSKELDEALKETNFGILCVTKENQREPWICFEAGALAKAIDRTNVVPYLIDMGPGELEHPLKQFHAIEANKENTLKLIKTIHKVSGDKTRSEGDLTEVFEKWWPDLEVKIGEAKLEVPETKISNEEFSPREIKAAIDKILKGVESISSRLANQETKRSWGSRHKSRDLEISEELEKYLVNAYNLESRDKESISNILARELIKRKLINDINEANIEVNPKNDDNKDIIEK
jgi:hypothetical protein